MQEMAWLHTTSAELEGIKSCLADRWEVWMRVGLELHNIYVRPFFGARHADVKKREYTTLQRIGDFNCFLDVEESVNDFFIRQYLSRKTLEQLYKFVQGTFQMEHAVSTEAWNRMGSLIGKHGDACVNRKSREGGWERYTFISRLLIGYVEEKDIVWEAKGAILESKSRWHASLIEVEDFSGI